MKGEGGAEAEIEGGAEVQEDTEVGAETGEVEVGLKLRDIILHPRETHLDLVASPHHLGRRNGISRKSWTLERFTKGTAQESREGRNGRRTILTEKGKVKEMEKKRSMDLTNWSQGKK